MKTLFKKSVKGAVAGIGVLALMFNSQAQVISWDIGDNNIITGGSQFAGLFSAPYWNNTYLESGNATGATVVNQNLTDSTGATTGVSVTQLSSQNTYNYWAINFTTPGQDADGTYNRNLLNGYQNDGSTVAPYTSSVTINNISYEKFDLFVYFSSDTAGRSGSVTDGTSTYYFSTIGPAETSGANALFTQTTETSSLNYPAADYAIFRGLTANTETITVNVPGFGGIAGFQIVPTPEPSSLALAAVGLVLVGVRRFGRGR